MSAGFAANRAAVVGAVVIALFVVAALLGPYAVAHDPLEQDLSANYQNSSWAHPLGTDHLGRDNLSRLISGARVSLTISVTSITIGLVVGAAMGLVAAYKGGKVDKVVMRAVDVLLAFPDILLAIAIVAMLGKGIRNMVIAVAIFAVPEL